MEAFGYGTAEVGYLLSGMGLVGMGVQGILVRLAVSACGEQRTLSFSMASTAFGFVALSATSSLDGLLPALAFVAIGYGLAVPCLSTLFSHVPVEQASRAALPRALRSGSCSEAS